MTRQADGGLDAPPGAITWGTSVEAPLGAPITRPDPPVGHLDPGYYTAPVVGWWWPQGVPIPPEAPERPTAGAVVAPRHAFAPLRGGTVLPLIVEGGAFVPHPLATRGAYAPLDGVREGELWCFTPAPIVGVAYPWPTVFTAGPARPIEIVRAIRIYGEGARAARAFDGGGMVVRVRLSLRRGAGRYPKDHALRA